MNLRQGGNSNLRLRRQESVGSEAGVRVGKRWCFPRKTWLEVFLGGAAHARRLFHHRRY